MLMIPIVKRMIKHGQKGIIHSETLLSASNNSGLAVIIGRQYRNSNVSGEGIFDIVSERIKLPITYIAVKKTGKI